MSEQQNENRTKRSHRAESEPEVGLSSSGWMHTEAESTMNENRTRHNSLEGAEGNRWLSRLKKKWK